MYVCVCADLLVFRTPHGSLLYCFCRTAAEYILPHLCSQRHKGVCFFSPTDRAWVILEARGRCMPKQCSPGAERDCFAIFDDARCRGADLKVGLQT